ncbi:MAG: nidogen-like domain-containing protein [Bacteroidota bacterium]
MLHFTKAASACMIISLVLFSSFSFSQAKLSIQNPGKPSISTAKGKSKTHFRNEHPSAARITPPSPHQAGELCNCWINRDATWDVVPFDCDGGSGGPGLPPDYRNDDWSFCLHLPFTFCFYGQNVDSVFINNNGNVSIGAPWDTYDPESFPTALFSMIAPLWSDVDTRGLSSGLVYYKLIGSHLVVQWDGVDYFESDSLNTTHLSLYNSYQLIMSNGVDPVLPAGQNVSFCYKDMNWTTGDASDGVDGFGGFPATCGVNQGDGVNYFQIGYYDAASNAWDGPYGNNDGIYSLSNQSFNFNVCDSSNTPPIAVANYVCDTLVLCEGDTGYVNVGYLSPEITQTTSIVIDSLGLNGLTILSDSTANLAGINMQIIAQPGNDGYHLLHLYATDNGTPPQTTSTYVVVSILNCGVDVNDINFTDNLRISPNPVSDLLTINYASANLVPLKIEIKNMLGQTIMNLPMENETSFVKTISMSSYPEGIYFVRLLTGKATIEKRFIKN